MRVTMLNKVMKHFIYKTTHKNGKYYIGRHSTPDLDDGYLGSGKWPRSIKDKSTLTRTVLEFAEDEQALKDSKEINDYLNKHCNRVNDIHCFTIPVLYELNGKNCIPELYTKYNYLLRIGANRIKYYKYFKYCNSKFIYLIKFFNSVGIFVISGVCCM